MSKQTYDPKHPVSHIDHKQDKRTSIPTTERQGEESVVTGDQPQQSEYDIFRNSLRRGVDPMLYWAEKYKNDDDDPRLRTDIRSLYVHEEIDPEQLITRLYKVKPIKEDGSQPEFFEDFFRKQDEVDELEKIAGFYRHSENWRNRLILGDSLLVMNSLLNREGMKGQVQCIYIDPPYGINYSKNWQQRINSTNVKDSDTGLSAEPETIKAYRDTWELGINSYLSYLRDRLIMARELLTESGSCFVQISDENVHLVRVLMDEIFGSENFVCLITFRKRLMPLGSKTLEEMANFIVWYAKDNDNIKYRQLYKKVTPNPKGRWTGVYENGKLRRFTKEEKKNYAITLLTKNVFQTVSQWAPSYSDGNVYDFEFEGKIYKPSKGQCWLTPKEKMDKLANMGRLFVEGDSPRYVMLHEDFPFSKLTSPWDDTAPAQGKEYVVQTSTEVIKRCILMTTDPGDLVLDPTCGSGTTAYVAEQWGRRWITIDTSRIALNIAKRRLTTALYPYYETYDENIRHGFLYTTVPHITLKSLANNLSPEKEVLYDQPKVDKRRIRVSGPLTVETLQNYNVQSPESLATRLDETEENLHFVERIFGLLKSSGISNKQKGHKALFYGLQQTVNPYLNARGLYKDEQGKERLAYLMIGPKFGTVSKQAVSMAIREFRPMVTAEGASTLYILGFSFEDDIQNQDVEVINAGIFHVVKVRMNDDLLQEGLTTKDKTAGSFIIIGEPDIQLINDDSEHYHVEIRGMDMYDPIQDRVTERNIADIAYWELDDDYSGQQFNVRAIHFCGGDKKEFAAWKKGLSSVAPKVANNEMKRKTVRDAINHQLRMEFPDDVWDTLYDYRSAPIKYEAGRKIAVRVVSQFGEECTKVLEM